MVVNVPHLCESFANKSGLGHERLFVEGLAVDIEDFGIAGQALRRSC